MEGAFFLVDSYCILLYFLGRVSGRCCKFLVIQFCQAMFFCFFFCGDCSADVSIPFQHQSN